MLTATLNPANSRIQVAYESVLGGSLTGLGESKKTAFGNGLLENPIQAIVTVITCEIDTGHDVVVADKYLWNNFLQKQTLLWTWALRIIGDKNVQ